MIFGLIPSGTGNDWAKSKNIPLNVSDAINLLNNGSINEQDVGVAKIVGSSKKNQIFCNILWWWF